MSSVDQKSHISHFSAAGPHPSSLELSGFEEVLLQLISLIYEPVSVSFLVKCLARIDLPELGASHLQKENMRETILSLREQGVLSGKNQCTPELAEYFTRRAVDQGHFALFASLIEKEAPVSYLYGKWATRCWRAIRQFRIGVYSGDFDKTEEAGQFFEKEGAKHLDVDPPSVLILARAFDEEWLKSLPSSMQFFLLDDVVRYCLENIQHFSVVLHCLENVDRLSLSAFEQVPFHRMLASYYVLQGRFDDLESLLVRHAESFQGSGFAGTAVFLRGDTEKALELFHEDLERLQQYSQTELGFFFGITAVFCILALLATQKEEQRREARMAISVVLNRPQLGLEELPIRFLDALLRSAQGDFPDMLALSRLLAADERGLTTLISVLSLHWMGIEIPPEFREAIHSLHHQAAENSFFWLAMETAALSVAIEPDQDIFAQKATTLTNKLGCRALTPLLTPPEDNEQTLQDLIALTSKDVEPEQKNRLVWLVDFQANRVELIPKEQKKNKGKGWSKGRTIALNRLMKPSDFDYLTGQDLAICSALEQQGESSAKNGGCVFIYERVLPALIGHPLLFLEKSPSVPVEVVAGEPELMVDCQGDSLFISFVQDIGEGSVAVWKDTASRFRIIRLTDAHRPVIERVGRDGLLVPMDESRAILDEIAAASASMTVHSAIDMIDDAQLAVSVNSESTIHIHIIPYGSGFRLEMFVRPFGKEGPYLKPGIGGANVMTEIRGERLQTRRDLAEEELKAREIEESCPMLDLATDLEQENKREWHLMDPEECLQALLEIEEIRDRVVLEWPEGKKIAVRRQTGINQLNLNIRTSQQDWFSLSGHLQVGENEVVELKNLLDHVKDSGSRFIPLEDGQFVALTQEFRDRLEELILYGNSADEDSADVVIHPLAAFALEDFTSQAQTTADKGWKDRIQNMQKGKDFDPTVPEELQAELRDYQQEGFTWMARLAHLGIGACLADDMGLGKTLQAISVVLSMADKGPTLVVAPTSVCMNWEAEVHKFAPCLKFHQFSGFNRADIIKKLGPRDLLVTSYTLLQQEIELLETVSWQSVVLDEAQAIKNAATKRSRAAMRLKARFRLITTGTPIENHLGELWNLFNFINHGLLGTYKQFNSRFGIPIEKYQDRDARQSLKKLIRPFMLRRVKSQVLDELPPRTEVTLRVEMQPEELQFYEALRQQAIENIEGNAEKTGRHLRILAEIMRLRRACCNPKLINRSIDIPSTKLKIFAEVVEELLAGGHKALVFSQFTGHLGLLREYLEKEEINYKYLDGTTPAKDRQRQVDEFQAGDGDLFLISLKAGGLGLNLTEADYVIHMDPWWNPAVEDQAADRAHRIGQKRPVTVYRLVAANTIEEKIVRLHQEKRDLANSLLEGSDVSARITADELLELIRSA